MTFIAFLVFFFASKMTQMRGENYKREKCFDFYFLHETFENFQNLNSKIKNQLTPSVFQNLLLQNFSTKAPSIFLIFKLLLHAKNLKNYNKKIQNTLK